MVWFSLLEHIYEHVFQIFAILSSTTFSSSMLFQTFCSLRFEKKWFLTFCSFLFHIYRRIIENYWNTCHLLPEQSSVVLHRCPMVILFLSLQFMLFRRLHQWREILPSEEEAIRGPPQSGIVKLLLDIERIIRSNSIHIKKESVFLFIFPWHSHSHSHSLKFYISIQGDLV